MDKTKILEMAKELGDTVAQSEVLINYANAKEAYENDEELNGVIREYSIQQKALDDLKNDETAGEDIKKVLRERIQTLYDQAMNSKSMKDFDDAENELNSLLGAINETIKECIFTQYPDLRPAPSSCSGNCSSCGGGCH